MPITRSSYKTGKSLRSPIISGGKESREDVGSEEEHFSSESEIRSVSSGNLQVESTSAISNEPPSTQYACRECYILRDRLELVMFSVNMGVLGGSIGIWGLVGMTLLDPRTIEWWGPFFVSSLIGLVYSLKWFADLVTFFRRPVTFEDPEDPDGKKDQ